MSKPTVLHTRMRVFHRYLGFFLAGIISVYAISGVILIFRTNDFLKYSVHETRTVEPNLSEKELGEKLRLRNLRFESSDGEIQKFKQGTYNSQTGFVDYTEKRYPFIIDKLVHLHKATTKDPLFFLNVFLGISLLFFVTTAFFMFMPGTDILKKGLWFTLAGILLTLLMLFV